MSGEPGFELRWATAADEPDIRALVGSVPMPGAVVVRFAREPNYFLGTTIMGDPCDVLIARHRLDGRLAGIACRAERRAYVNGRESALGYIGQIRVSAGDRGHWLVHRGAKWFREATPAGLLYMGVIAGENPRARALFVGHLLPGGPRATRVCGLTTCALLLRPHGVVRIPGVEILPGSAETLGEIVAFLRVQGPRRQFFPVYALDDFTGDTTLRGLRPEHVMVARRGGAVVGVMAAWDQAEYKQDVVEAYGPGLRRLRPAFDFGARLLGAKPLTSPGQAIPLAFAACVCVADDNPAVMQGLLSACARSARRRGKAFLMIGLADNDPLLAVARRTLHVTYHSDLFAVSWSDEPAGLLDDRVPYIEIATL
jgi:hypothetical protein